MAAFMPKSYLDSQPHPNIPVKDWLTWSVSELELRITNASNKIAGLIGINKARDLQYVFMPIIVPKALGNNATVVLGNPTDVNSEPALVYLNMFDLGTSVIKSFTKIPEDIHSKENLPLKLFKSTTWETAQVPLGLACIPIIAPIFFGMHAVKASVYDSDFDDKLGLISAKHLQWAKLIKENVNQQENDDKDYDEILGRISCGSEDPISKYATPGTFGVELLDTPFIQVFTLLKDKWKDKQAMRWAFFKGNSSPVCQPWVSLTSTTSSPVVNFANIQANATTTQTTTNNQPVFDPMSFMQQSTAQMMAFQQKFQTIVVESCED
jgi:hypothetical protein